MSKTASGKKQIRLDKYISDHTELTRSQAKKAIRNGRVRVNGKSVTEGNDKVSFSDSVLLDDHAIRGGEFQYIMLNKPAGVVSATSDSRDATVLDCIRDRGFQGYAAKDLFPVGRLDKDTVGLLLLTNDGELAHRLLSPSRHVPKTYFVRLDERVTEEDVTRLAEGLDIGEKHITRPARARRLSDTECLLTITEGKFHQVKRMFRCLGKRVLYLKRIEMGGLRLDESLAEGEWRPLTEEEVAGLKNPQRENCLSEPM